MAATFPNASGIARNPHQREKAVAEIFAIYILCRNIGRIVRPGGKSAMRYQFLAALLWFLFEILAALFAVHALQAQGAAVYLIAFIGALASIPLTFHIARSA